MSEKIAPELEKVSTHFFCEACLVDKPLDDRSADPRYCQGCCDFLTNEMIAAKAFNKNQATWWPKTTPAEKQPRGKVPEICAKTTDGQPEHKDIPAVVFAQLDTPLVIADTGPGGRPAKSLPVEKINEMMAQGTPVPEILRQLAAEGIEVSRRTIYYIKNGQRVLV